MAGERPAPRDKLSQAHFEPITETTVEPETDNRGDLTVQDQHHPTTIDLLRESRMVFEYTTHRQEHQENLPVIPESKGEDTATQHVKAEELTPSLPKRGRGRPPGRSPATILFDKSVKELRDEGLDTETIAKRLGVSNSRVANAAQRLINAGEINPARKGRASVKPEQLKQILQEFKITHPLGTISLKEMARELNVSREWARQLYERVKQTLPSIPPLGNQASRKFSEEFLLQIDQEIETRMKKGQTPEQIAEALHTTVAIVKSSRKRILKPQKENARVRKADLIEKIKELRSQGIGSQKIAEITGQKKNQINYRVTKLVETGEIKLMKRRKTRDAIPAFDARVRELRDEGLTYKEMAERMGTEVTVSHILTSLMRLQAKGKIKLKPSNRK
jgi:orotate phosphoribosyltransferase-like protein/DNA-binding CsgD family transcriptional regulator